MEKLETHYLEELIETIKLQKKTIDDINIIKQYLYNIYFFSQIFLLLREDGQQEIINEICSEIQHKHFDAWQVIIAQESEDRQNAYVIISGRCSVHIKEDLQILNPKSQRNLKQDIVVQTGNYIDEQISNEQLKIANLEFSTIHQEASDENIVFQKMMHFSIQLFGSLLYFMSDGNYFGQQSLLNKTKRSATVCTVTSTQTIMFDVKTFIKLKDQFRISIFQKRQFILTFFPQIQGIKQQKLNEFVVRNFNDQITKFGEVVIKQTSINPKNIYFVRSGRFSVSKKYHNTVEKSHHLMNQKVIENFIIQSLNEGQIFGEQCLLGADQYLFTITCVQEDSIILLLEKDTFNNQLPLESIKKFTNFCQKTFNQQVQQYEDLVFKRGHSHNDQSEIEKLHRVDVIRKDYENLENSRIQATASEQNSQPEGEIINLEQVVSSSGGQQIRKIVYNPIYSQSNQNHNYSPIKIASNKLLMKKVEGFLSNVIQNDPAIQKIGDDMQPRMPVFRSLSPRSQTYRPLSPLGLKKSSFDQSDKIQNASESNDTPSSRNEEFIGSFESLSSRYSNVSSDEIKSGWYSPIGQNDTNKFDQQTRQQGSKINPIVEIRLKIPYENQNVITSSTSLSGFDLDEQKFPSSNSSATYISSPQEKMNKQNNKQDQFSPKQRKIQIIQTPTSVFRQNQMQLQQEVENFKMFADQFSSQSPDVNKNKNIIFDPECSNNHLPKITSNNLSQSPSRQNDLFYYHNSSKLQTEKKNDDFGSPKQKNQNGQIGRIGSSLKYAKLENKIKYDNVLSSVAITKGQVICETQDQLIQQQLLETQESDPFPFSNLNQSQIRCTKNNYILDIPQSKSERNIFMNFQDFNSKSQRSIIIPTINGISEGVSENLLVNKNKIILPHLDTSVNSPQNKK